MIALSLAGIRVKERAEWFTKWFPPVKNNNRPRNNHSQTTSERIAKSKSMVESERERGGKE